MKQLLGYWPYLIPLLIGFGIAFLLWGVGAGGEDKSALKAAQRNEASAKKLADDWKATALKEHARYVADTTGDAQRAKEVAVLAKKAAELRAVAHPVVKKPNAYTSAKSPAVADSATRAATQILNNLPRP